MQIAPDSDSFTACYQAGRTQVVYTRLVADLETPVSAFMKLTRNAPYRFLLESVEGGAVRGRYSMIGMKPDLIWRVTGDKAEINTRALIDADGPFVAEDAPPLQSLRNLLAANHFDVPDDLPPMAAGLFGYMGYDMVRQMEQLPEPNEDVLGVPDGIMIRPTIMAIFDAVKDEVTIVTPVFPDADVSARAAYARACDRLAPWLTPLTGRWNCRPMTTPMRPRSTRRHPTPRRTTTWRWCSRPRSMSPPATSSRWCCHSVSKPISRCRHFPCTAPAPGQSVAVPVPPGIRPVCRHRFQPGNPGQGA